MAASLNNVPGARLLVCKIKVRWRHWCGYAGKVPLCPVFHFAPPSPTSCTPIGGLAHP